MTAKQAFKMASDILTEMKSWIAACGRDQCCIEGARLLALHRATKILTGDAGKADTLVYLLAELDDGDDITLFESLYAAEMANKKRRGRV